MGEPKWEWVARAVEVDTDGGGKLRLERRSRRFTCKPGEYPWDDWYCAARAAGIGTELALLGSVVMRTADQDGWADGLQKECGWSDDGAEMIAHALRDPEGARQRWQHLLDVGPPPVLESTVDEQNVE